MVDEGITYVAWGKGIDQAVRSASTARRFGYRTCLITNQALSAPFDHILTVDGPLETPTHKLNYYSLSPWETTLYLDTDTFVLDSLDFGFQQARRHGLCMAIASACYLGPHWGLPIEPDVQQYNAGVIFHHRSFPNFRDLWSRVEEIVRNEWIPASPPPINDQSALSLYLHRTGKHPFVLNPNWNLRPQFGMRSGFGPIKIWHCDIGPPDRLDDSQFWRVGNPYHRPQVFCSRLWTRYRERLSRWWAALSRSQ